MLNKEVSFGMSILKYKNKQVHVGQKIKLVN